MVCGDDGDRMVIVNEDEAPLARDGMLAVTMPLVVVKVQPEPASEMNDVPVGSGSCTTTWLAVLGPRLLTLIVYVRLVLVATVAAAVLVIARSAWGVKL